VTYACYLLQGPPSVVLENLDLPTRTSSALSDANDAEEDDDEPIAVFPSVDVIDVIDKNGVLVNEEEKETGVVKGDVYWSYWVAVGRCLTAMVLISIFFMQGLLLSRLACLISC